MNTPDSNFFNPKDHVGQKESYLQNPTAFHIIYIDDISKSKITKLEAWKGAKDPNEVGDDRLNNSRIIREVNLNEDANTPQIQQFDQSVYKLTLKDNKDNYCFAFEYNDKLPFLRSGVNLPIPIKLGGKLIVKRGTMIKNGTLLLNRAQCQYLGVDESSTLVKNLNANLLEKSINILQNPDL
ncbi:hypothetical protein CLIB1444_06S03598 [[Candida] jaroonii]|uniref:Uncharacterized protein n=1 Tax=[Candida] jaroonii TaxID=467808 RepID=A0ACA9Y9N5_9ASCO|nr:hypothetical protein CLIB1444_06S03598 [[Candida] jaroonii]